MLAGSFRRASTTSDMGNGSAESLRRPSAADTPRKSSIASLSLRLTRSKRTNSSSQSTEQRASQFGQLFFSLPCEIQTQIVCYLDTEEILSLRLSSNAATTVLRNSASAISRSTLDRSTSGEHREYVQTLYPQPVPCLNTDYLLQMLRRQNVIERMVNTIVVFIQMKIYMIRTGPRFEQFSVYRDRLLRKLYRPAWTLHHFLESYRHLIVYSHTNHPQSRFWDCTQCSRAISDLVASYPSRDVVPAFQLYQLTLLHLKASSRAPSYAGTIERRLRGWSRKPPTDDELAQIMILGGLAQLSRISMMKGTYNQRLEIIGSFIDKVSAAATQFGIAVGAEGKPIKIPAAATRMGTLGDDKDWDLPGKKSAVMKELDTPFEDLTEQVVENLPALTDFLIPEWTKRITDEQLVDHERELTSPFGYVQRIMAEDEEDDEAAQRGRGEAPVAIGNANANVNANANAIGAGVGVGAGQQAGQAVHESQHLHLDFPTSYG